MQVKAYKETDKVSSNTHKKDYIINIFVIKKQGSKERHGNIDNSKNHVMPIATANP